MLKILLYLRKFLFIYKYKGKLKKQKNSVKNCIFQSKIQFNHLHDLGTELSRLEYKN